MYAISDFFITLNNSIVRKHYSMRKHTQIQGIFLIHGFPENFNIKLS